MYFPLWEIRLEAPQYPEPIGMYIYINKVEGIADNDLENINLLNHYIGMKKIEPESIPELRYMKYIVWGFILLGLVVFFSKNRLVMLGWMLAITIVGILALYDFNKWEYDYGHNLDPRAPIKMEGMDYKPPLIGEKQLLNITAYSYPALGGIGFLFTAMIGLTATLMAFFKHGHEHEHEHEHENMEEQRLTSESAIQRIKYVTKKEASV